MRRAWHTISLGFAAGLISLSPLFGNNVEAATSLNLRPVVKVEGQIQTWLNVGMETMTGHTTYQIGYPAVDRNGLGQDGYFPFSELEFPLDTTYATAHLLGIYDDRWVFNVTAKKNITDQDDDMIDKDWLTASNPSQLDVYSDSNVTSFDGLIVDVDLSHKLVDKSWGWMAGGVGFMYEKFDYATALKTQYSPSGYPGVYFEGANYDTLLYEVSYYMPYLLGSIHLEPSQKFTLDARLGYAPYVKAEDRDQHLLRYKENTGDMEGWAATASVSASYYFTPYWFAAAGLNHTTIDVEGDMSASFYGVYDHTVTEKATSSQTSAFLTAGYRFGPFTQENGEKHERP
ncbi:MAG: omptin family outer membrane protease [Desulfobulbaceae bacterium]|nr:omptin family outer membrane protease [Desulfobulbaceae bacterium]